MNLTVQVLADCVAIESLEQNDLPQYADRRLQLSGVGGQYVLPTTAITLHHRAYVRLTSSATVDLTSVADSIYGTLDMTGKRLLAYVIKNGSSINSATVAKGATDGYAVNGNDPITLRPGQVVSSYCTSGMPSVSTSQKNIDVTLTDGTVELVLVFGTDAT